MSRFTFTTCCLLHFGLGIWLGTGTARNLTEVTLVTFALLLTAYVLQLWKTTLGFILGCLIATTLGFSHVASYRSRIPRLPTVVTIQTEGTITKPPDNRDGESRLAVTTNHQGQEVTFLAKAPPYPRFHYGDVVRLSGNAEQVEAIEDFNYPLFLERQGITHQIPRASVSRIRSGSPSIRSLLYAVRSLLESRAEQHIPEPEASLLNGILLGSRQNLSEELVAVLRQTGTSHIVAISGANITIVVGMLVKLLPILSLPAQRNATFAIGAILSLMTGASASVVRGSVVAGMAATVRAAGRIGNATSLILFPAACMLIVNPLYLRADPSFQLSLSAYIGIVILSKPIEKILKIPLRLLPTLLRGSMLETVAASAGTLPVSLTTFGTVSWIGLIANPAVLWLLPFITAIGGLFLSFPFLELPISSGSSSIASCKLSTFVTNFPVRKITFATVFVLLVSLALQRTYTPKDPGLSIWFLNVGQGASILIRTISNHFLLFDGGPGSQVLSELGEVLAPSQRKLDVIALSHPHADHLRGLIHVVQRYHVGEVWSSGSVHSSGDYAVWKTIINEKHLSHVFLASPQTVTLGSANVQVLHPTESAAGKEFSQTHDGNLSLTLSEAGRSILLAGDVAEKQELSMLRSCQKPSCSLSTDILQVAHHGSASGTTAQFLAATTPRIAVIPVGAQNKFKHPRAEVLERLTTANVTVWRTDTDGRVQLILLPTQITVTSTTGRSATYSQPPQPAPT